MRVLLIALALSLSGYMTPEDMHHEFDLKTYCDEGMYQYDKDRCEALKAEHWKRDKQYWGIK